jgi:threonine/homoserine efflux transporter RhtA
VKGFEDELSFSHLRKFTPNFDRDCKMLLAMIRAEQWPKEEGKKGGVSFFSAKKLEHVTDDLQFQGKALVDYVLKIQWFAVLLATIGLFLISFNGVSIGLGETLVLISAILYGAHFVALGEWSDGGNTYALTLIQITTLAVMASLLTVKDGYQLPPDSSVWSAILFTAFFATFLAFFIQTKAQSVMSATAASVLLAMETPFAVVFGLYFNNDPLTIKILTGGTLVMAAIGLVIWSDARKEKMRKFKHD